MDNPFADLVIGNVGHIQTDENKDTSQAVETRFMKEKRQTEEVLQSKEETEILREKDATPRDTFDLLQEGRRTEDERQDPDVNLSISKDQLREKQEKDESLTNVRYYALQMYVIMHEIEMK